MARSKQVYNPERYQREKSKHNARTAAWAAANPELRREISRRSSRKHHLKKQYGLTVEEAEEILARGCGVCGEEATEIDHDHATNKVRGGLCQPCNLGLGHFKDEPKRLRAAARYVMG